MPDGFVRHGMQEARGSSPLSSTALQGSNIERSSIAGVTESGHRACGGLCRRHEVSRWRRAGRGGAGPAGAGAAGSPSSKLLDVGSAVVRYADSAGRWRGSRTRCGGGSGRSTRWPGWTCCCTGSAGDLGSYREDGTERDAAVVDAVAEAGGFIRIVKPAARRHRPGQQFSSPRPRRARATPWR